jgi:hypothetical protein
LLRTDGTFGLIATNTIAEGDTREAGLKQICLSGGRITAASKNCEWPGAVSVVVTIVWVKKGTLGENALLNGKVVCGINSHLFGNPNEFIPTPLSVNAGKSFQGSVVYGMGFTFDDTDTSGVASPVAKMHQLIQDNPKNTERIFPFIGGSEVNSSPTQSHHRYIINFEDLELDAAGKWPELLKIVEEKVKPERDKLGGYSVAEGRRDYWWQYGTYTPALQRAAGSLKHVLVSSKQAYVHFAVAFVSAKSVFSHALVVFAFERFSAFSAMQSRVHEIWARFFSGTALSLSRYNPSDCFETFPFPAGFETNAALEAVGREYYEFRAALMQDLWLGLTEIYNLFHSPDDEALARLEALYRKRTAIPAWRTAESVPAAQSPLTLYVTPAAALSGIRRLRELHVAMDAAVLTAYGWTDLLPKCTCEFLLDYEDDESESGAEESGGRKKKKPWRYRWPEEIRDEVLARLLKLNAARAEEEAKAASVAESSSIKSSKTLRKKRDKHEGTPSFL